MTDFSTLNDDFWRKFAVTAENKDIVLAKYRRKNNSVFGELMMYYLLFKKGKI